MNCQTKNKNKHERPAFGLIELVIAASILSVCVISIWSMFIYYTQRVAMARARTVAVNIANEKMEVLRNMSYDDLGTTTGDPNGTLPASATVIKNGITYTTITTIRYYDDAADGLVTGSTTGKHVQFWKTDCSWLPNNAKTIVLNFYQNGVTQTIDFASYYRGNQFNWIGKVTIAGADQQIHLHTANIPGCPALDLQTQNVDKPFTITIDGVLYATYTGPDIFNSPAGISYQVIGQGGVTTTDTFPNDYKQVQVSVSWNKYPCILPATLTAFIAQRGQETASNTGVLFITVLDANGNAVPNATLHIANPTLGMPAIDETSDINGKRMIPVLTPSAQTYQVTVSKTGYSTAKTYDQTGGNPYPGPAHLTIQSAQVTSTTFIIDLLSSLQLTIVKQDDSAAASVGVTIAGTKTISRQSPYTLKYVSQNFTATAGGLLTVNPLEFDTYTVVAHLPTGDVTESIALPPNTNLAYYISPHTYTVTVRNNTTNTVLSQALVHLQRDDIGYLLEKKTDATGIAKYTSMHTGSITRTVNLAGYQTRTDTITINQGANTETVKLIPNP